MLHLGCVCHHRPDPYRLQAIAYGAPSRLRRPLIEKTFELGGKYRNKDAGTHLWYPYPDVVKPIPSLRHESLLAKSELTDILHEMMVFLDGPLKPGVQVSPSETNRLREAMHIYDKFAKWKESLPESLSAHGSVVPHVLLLR